MSDKTTPPNKRDQAIEKVLDYSARVDADISEHDTGWFYQWSAACEKLRNMEHERSKGASGKITPTEGLSLLELAGDESLPQIQVRGKTHKGGSIVSLVAVGGGSLPFLVEDIHAEDGDHTTWHGEFHLCDTKPSVYLAKRDGTVRLSDSRTGKARIVRSEDECQDDTELSAYQECIKLNGVITMGSTIAEPVR